MRKRVLSGLLIFSASVLIAGEKPNFLFILADDMGWTGTSVQMDESIESSKSDFMRTPNLEKLASGGMTFSRAYSPGPMCTPSRAGILTGKTPAELNMTAPGGGRTKSVRKMASPRLTRELPEELTTVAEALKEAGYATAHFGKWHLGSVSPSEHGFDEHDGTGANEVPESAMGPKDVFGLNERAKKFMQNQVEAGKPFYVQISHYAVHIPVEADPASMQLFSQAERGDWHDDVEYAAMTYDLDRSVGQLLDWIDSKNLADSTYVIFMSDNGAAGNHRRLSLAVTTN